MRFACVDLIRVNDRVRDLAGSLVPYELRSLDAIHLASARRLGDDLHRACTYDERMTEATEQLGLAVVAPS